MFYKPSTLGFFWILNEAPWLLAIFKSCIYQSSGEKEVTAHA